MREVVVREASLDDAEALREYASRLFSEDLPGICRRSVPTLDEERAFVTSYSEPSNSVLLLAEMDGQVVGLAGLLGRTLQQEAHVGAVGVSVERVHRGRGIGSLLLNTLLAWAADHGVTRVEIEAFANNPRAIRLYERVGFRHEGVRRGAVMVDGEPVDVVCLAHCPVA